MPVAGRLDANVREYELTKHLSLRLHFPVAFLQLLTTGAGEIALISQNPSQQIVAVGDRVNHQRYGLGRVLAVEGHGTRAQAQVDFGDQVMWLVLRHAPIEKI